MKKGDLKKINLPKTPGVYFFLKGKQILYIGKATSLADRVRSYFSKDLIEKRGPLLLDMVTQATSIKFQATDSVLEALILETNLIKKYHPKYNTKEKDNKSFNYVCITSEKIPRVLIERGRNLFETKKELRGNFYGPFPNGLQLKEAMKIIRRIFPYIDDQSSKKNNLEFYKQLGLTPNLATTSKKITFGKVLGRGVSEPDCLQKQFSSALLSYKNNIKNLKLFFDGKKKSVISNLKKEMMDLAKKKEFEKANDIKKKIFSLNHINDIALIKQEAGDIQTKDSFFNHRIEAYDIAHMSGKSMVGVMVVIEGGELIKKEYRKFIIKTINHSNDTLALEEVLRRRFAHEEWRKPGLLVVDGGMAQINKTKEVLKKLKIFIPVVSVVKDDRHKAKAIMGDERIINKHKKNILLLNAESHRFAIAFHKEKRSKEFLINKKLK